MDREEAIELLEEEKAYMISHCGDRQAEALKMAIKVLEQQPCEDAVSRQAMLEYQHCLYGKMPNRENHKLWKFITELPSVTPTRKKGKWIKSNIGGAKVCSVCNAHMGLSVFKFCPNCGAEMES